MDKNTTCTIGEAPILVTGAGGNVGAVGRKVVELLRAKNLPVRAMVHREDERAQFLRDLGAEVVVGDLTSTQDVMRVLSGCRRMYFGMAVSPSYLEATVILAAAAREQGNMEVIVNISQMTVAQMDLSRQTQSPQQRQHWLGEQVLDWSGLPVTHIRPTVFLEHPFFFEWAAESIRRDDTIPLPFGKGHSSPVSALDVARVVAAILEDPKRHLNKIYHLTGPRSMDMEALAKEYGDALGRTVNYVDIPLEEWQKKMHARGLPQHVAEHIITMAKLHAINRYDRKTDDIVTITGRPAMSVHEFVQSNLDVYGGKRLSTGV